MKKIAFLIDDISAFGGVERVVVRLTQWLANNSDYEVHIVSVFKPKNSTNAFEVDNKVKVTYLNNTQIPGGRFKVMKIRMGIIKKLKKTIDFDILVTLYSIDNIAAAMAKFMVKFKVIACQHGEYSFDSSMMNRLKRYTYWNLDKVQLLTKSDMKNYTPFTKKAIVVANPNPYEREFLYDRSKKNLTYVGRLSPEKSPQYLVRAFAKVKNKNGWRLIIVGDGQDRKIIEDIIKEEGIEELVDMKGLVKDVKSIYKEAGIVALTSQNEALPMVLIESKAFGIPAISFDITAARELINDGVDGILVKKNNIDEFANALEILFNDDEKRVDMAKAAFEDSKEYDAENICKQWIENIENL